MKVFTNWLIFHFISTDLDECDGKMAKSEVKTEWSNENVTATKRPDLYLVKRALQNLPDQKGSLTQICDWIEVEYPAFSTWNKNKLHKSVTSVLFLNYGQFCTEQNLKTKDTIWKIDPSYKNQFGNMIRKCRRASRNIPESTESDEKPNLNSVDIDNKESEILSLKK